MKYDSSILLIVILGLLLIGSQIVVRIVTQKLTRIRRNFYRQLCYFIALPLFMFASTISRGYQPPKPIVIPSDLSVSIEVRQQLVAVERYTEDIELYLEYNNEIFNLLIAAMFLFSVLPAFSLAYYYMKRLEAIGEDDERIL